MAQTEAMLCARNRLFGNKAAGKEERTGRSHNSICCVL
jgi:hypothetical protein